MNRIVKYHFIETDYRIYEVSYQENTLYPWYVQTLVKNPLGWFKAGKPLRFSTIDKARQYCIEKINKFKGV